MYFSRKDWRARFQGGVAIGRVKRVVIHHSWNPDIKADADADGDVDDGDRALEMQAIRGIERYHVTPRPAGNGFSAIGYNFLVSQAGNIYEGRGFGRSGAHAPGANQTSIGICLLLNGDEVLPTPEAIEGVREVIREAVTQEYLVPIYEVSGHKDVTPDRTCPGSLLYPRLREWFKPVVVLLDR